MQMAMISSLEIKVYFVLCTCVLLDCLTFGEQEMFHCHSA